LQPKGWVKKSLKIQKKTQSKHNDTEYNKTFNTYIEHGYSYKTDRPG